MIEDSGLSVARGLGEPPEGGLADPRDPLARLARLRDGGGLIRRWIGTPLRVAACIPETGVELIPDDTFILEAGFERLGGVDHRKGCYVGQEVTARMKHKTELRKGLGDRSTCGRRSRGHRRSWPERNPRARSIHRRAGRGSHICGSTGQRVK